MIKFGIIGTGAVANQHINSIRAIANAQLVAIASSSSERAKIATQKFGVKCYDNYLEMLDSELLDIVCICTASGKHLEPTLAAAQRGIHILTEKPLEITLARADEMISACEVANVKLGCAFQNRFHPNFIKIKQAILQNKLGRLLLGNAYIKWYRDPNYYASSSWRGTLAGDGGAALINQGIHTIDLLLDIMGTVKNVFGKTQTTWHDIEGEDLGAGIITFESGAMGTVLGSTALYPGYPERLEIYGEQGSIILEAGNIKAWNIKDEVTIAIQEQYSIPTGAANPLAIGHELHRALIEDMIDAIIQNREPLVNGIAARKSLALILAIYASSKMQQVISSEQKILNNSKHHLI